MIDRHQAAIRSAETNRSGPLRRIIGVEPSAWGTFFEALECGHKGRQHTSEDNVQFWIDRGQRRRCVACGVAAQGPPGGPPT